MIEANFIEGFTLSEALNIDCIANVLPCKTLG